MSEPKRRESPQPEGTGRAALCAECWYLLDSAGHRWGHELASLRPPPISGRVLQAIAGLGGEASVTEIREALGEPGGIAPTPKHVYAALYRLARTTPPRVTGRARRWRLHQDVWDLRVGH